MDWMPTSNENLIREVRDKKEATSKDNYLINYHADIWNRLLCDMDTTYYMRSRFFASRCLDGSKRLDGTKTLTGSVGNIEILPYYLIDTEIVLIEDTELKCGYMVSAEHYTSQDLEYNMMMISEFYNEIKLPVEFETDVLFRIRQTTRWKSKARSTYELNVWNGQGLTTGYGVKTSTVFFRSRHLDGSKRLDGTKALTGSVGSVETRTDYLVSVDNKIIESQELSKEYTYDAGASLTPELLPGMHLSVHYWYGRRLDGTGKLDGSQKLDTVPGRVEYSHDNVFEAYTVCQVSGSIG